MKDFLIKAFSLAFLFFLSIEFYVLLSCSAKALFHLHHSHLINISAAIVSIALLTSTVISLCKKCKTFNKNDHKINKIR